MQSQQSFILIETRLSFLHLLYTNGLRDFHHLLAGRLVNIL